MPAIRVFQKFYYFIVNLVLINTLDIPQVEKEIGQRKEQAKKLIDKGVVPSPGYVVFVQVDAEKKRKLQGKELERLIKAIGCVFKDREIEGIDKIMEPSGGKRCFDIDHLPKVRFATNASPTDDAEMGDLEFL